MENRKIKVKSLISVTAWVVALGMFIAYLFPPLQRFTMNIKEIR